MNKTKQKKEPKGNRPKSKRECSLGADPQHMEFTYQYKSSRQRTAEMLLPVHDAIRPCWNIQNIKPWRGAVGNELT
jgi:hypothetical protein